MRDSWIEVKRVFSPSTAASYSNDGFEGTGLAYKAYLEHIERMAYGFTSIELRNEKNGDVKFITQIGDQTK